MNDHVAHSMNFRRIGGSVSFSSDNACDAAHGRNPFIKGFPSATFGLVYRGGLGSKFSTRRSHYAFGRQNHPQH